MPPDSRDNEDYYQTNADEFFAATVAVDMDSLHASFLKRIPPGGHILDAGCGSGRDAKAFSIQGFRVTAFDGSPALASLASEHVRQVVHVRLFKQVDEVACYDGIWACASLLHLPEHEVPDAIERLWRALKPGGCFYFSFKHGKGERQHGGRRFTDADASTVAIWLDALTGLAEREIWTTRDRRPERNEEWINVLTVKDPASADKLVTGGDNPFLPHLCAAIRQANEIDIAVAFTKVTGLRLLLPELHDALEAGEDLKLYAARIRFLTSDYLDVTDPEALRLLMLLQEQGAQVRVFEATQSSFHLKAYVFTHFDGNDKMSGTAFIGSSNISRQALKDGLEWNYRVSFPGDHGFIETRNRFEELFRHPNTLPLSDGWIDRYEARRIAPPRAIAPGSEEKETPPIPTAVQVAALNALNESRRDGFRRGLVVLATGLGKTWLAAFDAGQVGAKRILFIAHREEILNQAAETFLRIRPKARTGFYMGKVRDTEVEVLCASVQTLSRSAHLERFSPQHFDYIVIDEFHHASSATYRRVINYFSAQFMLGLTATPDRTDQSDILTLCDDNLVFTQDLVGGINADLLVPFHYFGIFDSEVDYRSIPWRNGRFDPEALSSKLATLGRFRHALAKWKQHAQQRTLAFCASVRHADFMAAQFVKAGIPAAAAYAGSTLSRAEALSQLSSKQLSVIFSVDLFNEGVDLPGIDTVMMLRPTESKILFLQQLGRGLRRAPGKEKLVVLDFVGNHQSFLHKPQALLGIPANFKSLARFGREIEQGALQLPKCCYVNYDIQLIDFLKSLDGAGAAKEYEALKQALGRRPTLTEFYRSGASVIAMRRQFGNWYGLLLEMSDLEPDEIRVLTLHSSFLREIEATSMTKSYKMVMLEALLEIDGWRSPSTLAAISDRSLQVLQRRRSLLADIPTELQNTRLGSDPAWIAYWRKNPINAWLGGNRPESAPSYFTVMDERLIPTFSVAESDYLIFESMVHELLDYRLTAYESRRDSSAAPDNVIPLPLAGPKPSRVEVPYFPNLKIACGHFKTGSADAEEYRRVGKAYGNLDP
jgi:superfamily II DNA or RNA helicase/HKD family nuclease